MADTAQRGVLEFLLINHPLDCPVCDKGGECPLQNQAMSHGRGESRFTLAKRTFPKPVPLSTADPASTGSAASPAPAAPGSPTRSPVTRSSRCSSAAASRSSASAEDTPFNSYFSGNTVQICPVGALTSATYRFRARPFDLVSTPTVCEHCAGGCALRTDVRRSTVMRRLAWDDPEVNEEWNCDKGRFAFPYLQRRPRLDTPLVRVGRRAGGGVLAAGRAHGRGGRWPAPGARTVRAHRRPTHRSRTPTPTRSSPGRCWAPTPSTSAPARPRDEEADLLRVGRRRLRAGRDLRRPRRGARGAAGGTRARGGVRRSSSCGCGRPSARARRRCSPSPRSPRRVRRSCGARVLAAAPGQEPACWRRSPADEAARRCDPATGSVILVGERAAAVARALIDAARELAERHRRPAGLGAAAGRRARGPGGRALPGLLPWGRPLSDPQARAQVAAAWGIDADDLPTRAWDCDLRRRSIAAVLADAAARGACADTRRGARRGRSTPWSSPGSTLADAAGSGGLPGRAGRGPLRAQPGDAQHRGHRSRRRRAAGGRGHREVRDLRGLGGPRPSVPRRSSPTRPRSPTPGPSAWSPQPWAGRWARSRSPTCAGARRAGPVAGARPSAAGAADAEDPNASDAAATDSHESTPRPGERRTRRHRPGR